MRVERVRVKGVGEGEIKVYTVRYKDRRGFEGVFFSVYVVLFREVG